MIENINIGIDLGGSHVAVGAVDKNGKILEQFEKDFTVAEKRNLLNVSIKYIVETIEHLKKKYSFHKIGLGVAGTISNGIIVRSVNLGIENFDIKTELETKTDLEVMVKNDAKCEAIAEYLFGNFDRFRDREKKYQNVLFLTLGTGIGGSYIYQGKLMEGTIFEGFEFGHMMIKENGLPCKCGKKGCFEKYGSILAFKTKVIEKLNLSHDIPGQELRKKIDDSREEIKDIVEEYINDLAIGISNLVNILEPDCIIIGGGFARYDYLLLDGLKEKMVHSNLLFNLRKEILMKTASLGNDAGIIGASNLE